MTKGRPRLKGPREPNGRRQRQAGETERQAREVVVGARVRVHGVSPHLAVKQEAGTLIGRMLLAGDITQAQYDAAVHWREVRARLEWAIDAPDRPRVPREGNGSADPERTVEAVRAALSAWDSLAGYVRATPGLTAKEISDLLEALDAYIMREDLVATLFMPLRRALDRIDDFVTRARKST